eukprot:1157750-Pelagomonas_calceolata.AAC.11
MHATAEAFGHCHNEGFYALSQRRPLGIITEKAFIHRHSRVIIDLRNFPGFLKKGARQGTDQRQGGINQHSHEHQPPPS